MSSMGKNEPFSIPSYERTLLKPPYELLLSNFRSDQKAVEKEIAQLTNFMAVKLPTMGLSLKDTIRTMEKLSARLEKLKQTVLQADERSIQSLGTLAFRRKVLKRTGTRQGMPRREDMMVGVQNDAEKGGEKEPEGGVPSSSSVSSASSSAAAAAASGGVVVKVEEECEGEDVKMTPASPDEKETEREKKNLASSPSSPLDDLEDSVGERVANSLQRLQLPLGRLGDSLSLLEDAGLKDAERAGARERAKKRAQVTQTLPTVAEEPTAKTAAEEPDEDRQGKEAEGRKTDHQAQLARRGMGISRGREQYGGGPHGAEFCGIIKALIQRAEMGNEGVHADLAVCEWMERKGMYKTAVAFAKAQNIEGLVDREFLHRIREVKSALARGETASAFEFCTLHRARLKKVSCLLEARLLFEVFLWTLHEKGPLAALEYSRKNVPPEAFESISAFRRACALMVLQHPHSPVDNPSSSSSSQQFRKAKNREKRWRRMAETFEREALTAFDIPTCPLLEIFLQTGMLALRSSACSSSSALCSRNGAGASASASGGQGQRGGSATAAAADGPGRDLPFDAWSRPGPLTSTLEECHAAIARRAQQVEDDKQKAQQRAAQQLQQKQEKQRMWASRQRSRCLTCDPAWSPYLSRIPAPQRIHSTLVCPLSGDLMDTLNPPMASPSGSVFSLEAIKQIVETAKDEMFTDPVSGEKLTLKEFQRVFVT